MASLLEHLHASHGPIVDVGYGPLRSVFVFGPEGNQQVLADRADHFAWGPALRLLEVVDGPTALVLSDGDDHRRRRRLVQPAFAVRRIEAHLPTVVAEIDRVLDAWVPGRRLDAHVELRAGVRRTVVRGLFGDELGAQADAIGERLEPALRYLLRSPFARIDVDLGFNAYARAKRAVAATDELIQVEIDRRRRSGILGDDILGALLAGVGGDDRPLSDDELRDQVRSLIAAGYDTTSASAAWLVHALGAHPAVRVEVAAEIRDTLGDRPPTVDDLRRMPLVDGTIREVLRLWPPGVVSARVAIDAVEMLGHRIPAGRTVLYSGYVSQRLPEVWGDPDAFRPQRWAEGEPVPYAFVPFGGGARRCLGFALATLELQVLAIRLLQRVEWKLERPMARGAGTATFAPAGGVPIRVR